MWTLHEGDCLDIMPKLPDKSVDMILCDLPYGTTACKWDVIIPFEPLWEQYERLIKNNGAIVLTASQPFTSLLITSNLKLFRYEWVWDKKTHNNFCRCNKEPLKRHENIVVFSNGDPKYYPQKSIGKPYRTTSNPRCVPGKTSGTPPKPTTTINSGDRFPISIQVFTLDKKVHPTQKPVALFEYLIRTYTKISDTVLDNCAGSGTTGVACENTGRNSILIEREPKYCEIIRKRLSEPQNVRLFDAY